MSATFGTRFSYRTTPAGVPSTTAAYGTAAARVDDNRYLVLGWDQQLGRHRLALFSAGNSLLGTRDITNYAGVDPAYAYNVALLPITDGYVALELTASYVEASVSYSQTAVWVVDCTTSTPVLGTPWTYSGSGGTRYLYRALAASSAAVLLCRTSYVADVWSGQDWTVLARSGTSLSLGGTSAPHGDMDFANGQAVLLDTSYFAVAYQTATNDLKIGLLSSTGGAPTMHGSALVTTSVDVEWAYQSGYYGPAWCYRDFVAGTEHLVVPARTGTTPTFTTTSFTVPGGSWWGGTSAIQVGGSWVLLCDSTEFVQNGEDPPVDTTQLGDLYVSIGTVVDGLASTQVVESLQRGYGSACAVRLTADRGVLIWGENVPVDYDDATITILNVVTATDSTEVDDVGSIITNYLGGEVIDAFLRDQPTWLALFTADPSVTGSMVAEVVGGDYERLPCVWTPPGSKTTALGELRFLNMPVCTVTHLGVCDAPTGGNMLIVKALPAPIVVADSAEFRIPADAIVVTL